jgi:hypothetical protein
MRLLLLLLQQLRLLMKAILTTLLYVTKTKESSNEDSLEAAKTIKTLLDGTPVPRNLKLIKKKKKSFLFVWNFHAPELFLA